MLVQAGFEFSNASLEEQELLVLVGKLLLLEWKEVQQCADEAADCWRGCRPVFGSDAIGWCQVVHAASMS